MVEIPERRKDCPPVEGGEMGGGGEEEVMARRRRREQGMMGKLVGEKGELGLQWLLEASLQERRVLLNFQPPIVSTIQQQTSVQLCFNNALF